MSDPCSVTLSPAQLTTLQDAVAAGEAPTIEHALAAAIEEWAISRFTLPPVDELRRMVQEGIDSGPGQPAELVFARLRAKYEAML